jgi:hypothetical protein
MNNLLGTQKLLDWMMQQRAVGSRLHTFQLRHCKMLLQPAAAAAADVLRCSSGQIRCVVKHIDQRLARVLLLQLR